MTFIADVFLTAGALAAGFYCFVLSRRLRRFTDLEHGVGGAIAVLSVQVDDLSNALNRAETTASSSANSLVSRTQDAEEVIKRLEIFIASMHDLPQPATPESTVDPFFVRQSTVKQAVGAE